MLQPPSYLWSCNNLHYFIHIINIINPQIQSLSIWMLVLVVYNEWSKWVQLWPIIIIIMNYDLMLVQFYWRRVLFPYTPSTADFNDYQPQYLRVVLVVIIIIFYKHCLPLIIDFKTIATSFFFCVKCRGNVMQLTQVISFVQYV